MSPAVTVIGIGADGWTGLTAEHRQLVLDADIVLGGRRHLDLLPASENQIREPWPSPLRESLPALLWKYDGRRVVALASGDPFVSGIGGTLVEILGPGAVVVEPTVSSVALARARMGWDAETVDVVSVVGRDVHRVLRSIAPGHRSIVLSS
ncbi:MAG TPA: precorrin-6y C5,15-methyltransferase (decarboxylating) subunit CbiE, partial [Nocardioides sp.]